MALNSIRVPSGHVLVNDKWRGSKLGQEIQQKCSGVFSSDLKSADFYPADKLPVLFISSKSYASDVENRQRLKSFFEDFGGKGVVLAERTTETIDAYTRVQDWVTFSLNLCIMPISGPTDLADYLTELGYTESRALQNPFKPRKEPEDLAHTQLSLLMLLPGVGRKKCLDLLNKFGHFQGIANASEFDLASVVGHATATSVYNFFHTPYISPK